MRKSSWIISPGVKITKLFETTNQKCADPNLGITPFQAPVSNITYFGWIREKHVPRAFYFKHDIDMWILLEWIHKKRWQHATWDWIYLMPIWGPTLQPSVIQGAPHYCGWLLSQRMGNQTRWNWQKEVHPVSIVVKHILLGPIRLNKKCFNADHLDQNLVTNRK